VKSSFIFFLAVIGSFMCVNAIEGPSIKPFPENDRSDNFQYLDQIVEYYPEANLKAIDQPPVSTGLRGGISGNYTINKNEPTAGSNFNSFGDFVVALTSLGLSGPATLEVVHGSGPYTEQVILGVIAGSSLDNKLIINGNGEVLQYLSTNTDERATLKLNGTDYITVNNLVIKSLGSGASEYGYPVHLMNGADHNTFLSCRFMTDVSSTSQNYAAFVSSNNANNAVATGLAVNHLTLSNCTAIGGYYGIIVNGPTVAPWSVSNTVTNNIIRDFYQYGLYLRGQNNTVVENNDISRPERTSVSTTYMLYLANDMTGTRVLSNRIHTLAGAGVTTTTTANGIYGTLISSSPESRLLIANNLVYGFSGMNGGQYGIYMATLSTAPAFVRIYHNTVLLDNIQHPGGSLARGIYQAGASTSGGLIDIKNNIIYITTNSTGNKHGLYFLNPTANISSDHNILFNGATAGSNFTGFWNSNGYTTLSDWQTQGFDLNSADNDPVFIDQENGDLTPQSEISDNMGTDLLAFVPIDFFGNSRTVTPDPGAVEYTAVSCFPPTGLKADEITLTTLKLSWVPAGDETAWNIEYGINGYQQGTGLLMEDISDTSALIAGLSPGTVYDTYIQSVCGGTSVSAWIGPFVSATLCEPVEIPVSESFDAEFFPPLCWTRTYVSGAGDDLWSRVTGGTTPVVQPHSGEGMAQFQADYFPSGTMGLLVAPGINIGSEAVAISFWMYRDEESPTVPDLVKLYFNTSPNMENAVFLGDIYRAADLEPTVPSAGWYRYGFSAPTGATNQTGYFMLEGVSAAGNNIYIDDVEIEEIEPGNLAGNVVSAAGGPVQGARIFSGAYEAFSDESGNYLIEGIIPGIYTFTCTAEGYLPSETNGVLIQSLQTTTLGFVLGYAQIQVNPGSLDIMLHPDSVSSAVLNLSNPAGTGPLTWSSKILYPDKKAGRKLESEQGYAFEPMPLAEIADHYELVDTDTPSKTIIQPYRASPEESTPVLTERTEKSADGQLWVNGPFITHQGAGAGGNDVSAVQSNLGMTSYGPNVNHGASPGNYFYLADEFEVTGKWTLNTITFYGYQTLSGTNPTITGVYVQIWDDAPHLPGSNVVWGNLTGNRLLSASFSGVYRAPVTDLLNTQRPVMQIVADVSGCTLTEGQYWVQFGLTGSLSSGPWGVPVTILGETSTGNALQKTSAGWQPVLDAGTLAPQGIPFIIQGTQENWLTVFPASGTIDPGQSQNIQIQLDAGGLEDDVYDAIIRIDHNGQQTARGITDIPVQLTVIPPSVPGLPSDPRPAAGASLVSQQPVFEWINGAFTTQVKIKIERAQFPIFLPLYESSWFTGNSFDLSTAGITLLPKTSYRWRIIAENSVGVTNGPWWNFQTIGFGVLTGTVTDSFYGNALEGVTLSLTGTQIKTITGPGGYYQIQNVPEGLYEVKASFSGYVSQTSGVQIIHGQTATQNFQMSLYLDPPTGLQADVTNFVNVGLSWNAPGSVEELFYDNDTATAFYISPGFVMSTRMSPASPCRLMKLKYYTSTQPGGFPFNATVFGWNGNQPGNEIIYQQTVNAIELAWLEVDVSSQNIMFNSDFMVGFGSVNPLSAIGFDANLNNGRSWDFNTSTGNWTTWTQAYLIRAVVKYLDGKTAELIPESIPENGMATPDQTNDYQKMPSPIAITQKLENVKSKDLNLLGYHIYRNGEFLSFTTETEYADLGLAGGIYEYSVTAVYPEGESEAAAPVSVEISYMGTLTGTVTDHRVIAGVSGVVITADGTSSFSTTTDNQGNYLLNVPVGAYVITAAKAGYHSQVSPSVTVNLGEVIVTHFTLDFTGPELLSVEPDFSGVSIMWEGNPAIPPYGKGKNSGYSLKAGGENSIEEYLSDQILEYFENASVTCTVNCPPGVVLENETCGTSANGGCNSGQPAFQNIAAGDIICGTSWANGTQRDTDWFQISIDSPKTLSWNVTSEFPGLIFIIDGNRGCGDYVTLASEVAEPCIPVSVTATVPPGTYWLWVGPISWELNIPCGSSNDYTAQLTMTDAFLSYFNLYRDGNKIAELYQNYYYDSQVSQGISYCYSVDQVVEPGLITEPSDTLCTEVPVQPVISINPSGLTHYVEPGETAQQELWVINSSEGALDYSVSVSFINGKSDENSNKTALWDNGPLLTGSCVSTGNPESMPQSPHTATGVNNNQALNYSAADDFTVPEGGNWIIESIAFFGYQTDAGIVPTINGIYLRIWDGNPMTGATVIWGDLITNLFSSAGFTGIYRVSQAAPCLTNRAIHKIVAATPGLILTPGNYWVEFCMTGSTSSGPWIPFTDIPGVIPTGNGIVRAGVNWSQYTSGGAGVEWPFIVTGSVAGPWLSVTPLSGSISGAGETELTVMYDASELEYGVYDATIMVHSNDPVNPVVMIPVMLYAGFPSQTIVIPEGWSGWSSYIEPQISTSFAGVISDISDHMIISQYFSQLYYPAFGINTMGDYSRSHGYLSKMTENSILEISGITGSSTISLTSGWNLISVPASCSLEADSVFGEIPGLVIAAEVAGNAIYYPEMQIFTLTTVHPGKAYWVKVNAATGFPFPPCNKNDVSEFKSPLRFSGPHSWNKVHYTAEGHIVAFSESALSQMDQGDQIGAFNGAGFCSGLVQFDNQLVSLVLFGDDPTTVEHDGFKNGEPIHFRVFREKDQTEYRMEVTYSANAPNNEGVFISGGISVVEEVQVVETGISSTFMGNVIIFPNPSSGIFQIKCPGDLPTVTWDVKNATAQTVATGAFSGQATLDLSKTGKGVYYIILKSGHESWVEKLIIQ